MCTTLGVLKQEVIRELKTSQDFSEFYCGVVVFTTPLGEQTAGLEQRFGR